MDWQIEIETDDGSEVGASAVASGLFIGVVHGEDGAMTRLNAADALRLGEWLIAQAIAQGAGREALSREKAE
jgi:hypothetical protein